MGLIFFVIVSSYVLFLSLKEHRLFKRKRQVKANAADRARAVRVSFFDKLFSVTEGSSQHQNNLGLFSLQHAEKDLLTCKV